MNQEEKLQEIKKKTEIQILKIQESLDSLAKAKNFLLEQDTIDLEKFSKIRQLVIKNEDLLVEAILLEAQVIGDLES
jgi:hypothetical protein